MQTRVLRDNEVAAFDDMAVQGLDMLVAFPGNIVQIGIEVV
jgi:hypothetical protein